MASGGQGWGLQAVSPVGSYLYVPGRETQYRGEVQQQGVARQQAEYMRVQDHGWAGEEVDQRETSFGSAQMSPKRALGSRPHTPSLAEGAWPM